MKAHNGSYKSFSWQCASFIESMAKRYFLGAGKERDADWYDRSFDNSEHWREHYSKSKYYFIWTVIADRLIAEDTKFVLDIGCGPGQLATVLRDVGIEKYHGLDFSAKRIDWAHRICPQFSFSVEDAFETDIFFELDYDTVVCTEFLEHIERDLEVIARIRCGTRFLATVPNFPYSSHVRHFENVDQVRVRYQPFFEELKITQLLANDHGKVFYILDGIVI
jgi:SAM-dependent methyltransferase